ncbi:MAG: hypothetical protein NW216_00830 [Hyphomicrobium sp.]|nr:hypothetical protein [Hyphomicrobium sp.]
MPLHPRGTFGLALRAARSIAVASFILAIPTAVTAASVTNRDDREHVLTISEGAGQKGETLKPGQALDGICSNGCLVRLNGDDANPYELQGSDMTSIEGGKLYIDQAPEAVQPSDPGVLDPR